MKRYGQRLQPRDLIAGLGLRPNNCAQVGRDGHRASSARASWVLPDGLTFKAGTCGDLLGYAWMVLPLTEPRATHRRLPIPTGKPVLDDVPERQELQRARWPSTPQPLGAGFRGGILPPLAVAWTLGGLWSPEAPSRLIPFRRFVGHDAKGHGPTPAFPVCNSRQTKRAGRR